MLGEITGSGPLCFEILFVGKKFYILNHNRNIINTFFAIPPNLYDRVPIKKEPRFFFECKLIPITIHSFI